MMTVDGGVFSGAIAGREPADRIDGAPYEKRERGDALPVTVPRYSARPIWEHDYVEELFEAIPHRITYLPGEECFREELRDGVVVWNSNELPHYLIARLIPVLRPRVLFHFADEWGYFPKACRLYAGIPLVLRQYRFESYGVDDKALHLPLGYMTGMLEGRASASARFRASIEPPSRRRYTWSFIGGVKQDREAMIRAFQPMTPNFCETSGAVPPIRMRDVYLDSIFVLNGRGNVRISCFRLYEASLCGAIPVVVGSKEELAEEFRLEGDPPWIFSASWSDALRRCQSLLQDADALAERQKRLLRWWAGRIGEVKRSIARALHSGSTFDAEAFRQSVQRWQAEPQPRIGSPRREADCEEAMWATVTGEIVRCALSKKLRLRWHQARCRRCRMYLERHDNLQRGAREHGLVSAETGLLRL